ncbi:MarR family winged helix-turn-helix transcriptional regulator [Microtetraspora fusca]|uniref:MarR family winged helix-turn-helix transcriptional regulator n=1 Tax=Microtetraspora fusca TaxID=1997 RepID=UPI0012FC1CA8|nr:MarR family transcriptional regulator [Microtetraspora fusca]
MDDPRWLSSQEQRAWRAHLTVHRLLSHQLDRELHEAGLSLNDYEILVNLSESPRHRMRMSDLADATVQSRSRLSHQISRMEAAGLVTREHCEDDRRGMFAVLTGLGWETIQRVAWDHVASVRHHFIDRLTADQVTALETIYAPIVDHLQRVRAGKAS